MKGPDNSDKFGIRTLVSKTAIEFPKPESFNLSQALFCSSENRFGFNAPKF